MDDDEELNGPTDDDDPDWDKHDDPEDGPTEADESGEAEHMRKIDDGTFEEEAAIEQEDAERAAEADD